MHFYQLAVLAGALFSFTLLNGCSSVPQTPAAVVTPIPYSLLLENAAASIPTLDEIFELTPEQQAEFLAYYNAPERQQIAGHRRLYQFLERQLSGFNYLGQNLTASEAYELNSGNCMSLALLTKALADVAGIAVDFQIIVSAPVYNIDNDFMVSSDHVRTFLYDPTFQPEDGMLYFTKPALIVDYLPASGNMTGPRISHQTFIAMFYRNLAADKVLAEQYEEALALLRTAMVYAPAYGEVINLAAVVHRRLDEIQLAEQFYQYGLAVAESKIALVSNYAMLKQLSGEHAAAKELFQYLQTLNDRAPYSWYLLGKTATQQHRNRDAIVFFNKAVEQAPYMHQLQLELALAYFRDEQFGMARQTLLKAAELISTHDTEQRYLAKLEALKLHQSAD